MPPARPWQHFTLPLAFVVLFTQRLQAHYRQEVHSGTHTGEIKPSQAKGVQYTLEGMVQAGQATQTVKSCLPCRCRTSGPESACNAARCRSAAAGCASQPYLVVAALQQEQRQESNS